MSSRTVESAERHKQYGSMNLKSIDALFELSAGSCFRDYHDKNPVVLKDKVQ
jgi:hypothetical protein